MRPEPDFAMRQSLAHESRRHFGMKPVLVRGVVLDRRDRLADLVGLLSRDDIDLAVALEAVTLGAINSSLDPSQ